MESKVKKNNCAFLMRNFSNGSDQLAGLGYIRPIENGTQYCIAIPDCRDLVWG
jgi:hypothetical protein